MWEKGEKPDIRRVEMAMVAAPEGKLEGESEGRLVAGVERQGETESERESESERERETHGRGNGGGGGGG